MAADSNPPGNTQKTIFAQVQPLETHERYRVFDGGGVTLPFTCILPVNSARRPDRGVRKGSQ